MQEVNLVPPIDILLVLLVIFMIIPNSRGMKVEIPQPATREIALTVAEPDVVVVQVLTDGSLKLKQQPVPWKRCGTGCRMSSSFAPIASGLFAEFQVVAKVIDDMHAAGISSVGLLTPELETSL